MALSKIYQYVYLVKCVRMYKCTVCSGSSYTVQLYRVQCPHYHSMLHISLSRCRLLFKDKINTYILFRVELYCRSHRTSYISLVTLSLSSMSSKVMRQSSDNLHLRNVRNSCYINSTLNFLFSMEEFRSFIISNDCFKVRGRMPVCNSLYNIFSKPNGQQYSGC